MVPRVVLMMATSLASLAMALVADWSVAGVLVVVAALEQPATSMAASVHRLNERMIFMEALFSRLAGKSHAVKEWKCPACVPVSAGVVCAAYCGKGIGWADSGLFAAVRVVVHQAGDEAGDR